MKKEAILIALTSKKLLKYTLKLLKEGKENETKRNRNICTYTIL